MLVLNKKFALFFGLFSMTACLLAQANLSYEVEFIGLIDPQAEAVVRQASKMVGCAARSAASLLALKRRGELDISLIAKALQTRAYYNAKVSFAIDAHHVPVRVVFNIDLGRQYAFEACQIVSIDDMQPLPIDVGLVAGMPAYTESIVQAEARLLHALADMGHPHATLHKRDVIADQQKQTIAVHFSILKGLKLHFGACTIQGNKHVSAEFIRSKIAWQEGQVYHPALVESTREALEATGLFSLVAIQLLESSEAGKPAMVEIQVTETKHRSIAAGASFTTQLGLGSSLEWEHRNLKGCGRRLNALLDLWQKKQQAKASYILPDFGRVGQDLIWSLSIEREHTRGYHETSVKCSGLFESNFNERLRLGYGGLYQTLFASHSVNNGTFHLFKIPLSLHYSCVDDFLDPSQGYTLSARLTPALQISRQRFAYCPAVLTSTLYYPMGAKQRFIIAAKTTFGTILGASRRAIPPSELFYAGSENCLRGYRYLTVSPLNSHGKPTGGKSMAIASLEGRLRLNESFGIVGFYEIGNVYASPIIQLQAKQLQSAGFGLRYHKLIPIRFDVAFPLNKRKAIDSSYQFYMSIGQSF